MFYKKILSTVMALMLLINVSPTVSATSGSCGTNVFWDLNEITGSLTIYGSGNITSNPWYIYSSAVKTLIIENGITSINDLAFSGCDVLNKATISDGINSIGRHAFNACYELKSVTIGGGINSIGRYAFNACYELKSVTIGCGIDSIDSYAFNACQSLTVIIYMGINEPKFDYTTLEYSPKVKVPFEYESSTFCGKPIDKCLATVLCGTDKKQYVDINAKEMVICGKTIKKPTNGCKYQRRSLLPLNIQISI